MAIEARLETLEQKHTELEQELHSVLNKPSADDIEITEIKRRKLLLKDEIQRLRSEVV